jgi:hypothetical protein
MRLHSNEAPSTHDGLKRIAADALRRMNGVTVPAKADPPAPK